MHPGTPAYTRTEAEIIRIELRERIDTALAPYIERARESMFHLQDDGTIEEQLGERFNVDPEAIGFQMEKSIKAGALAELICDLHHACAIYKIDWSQVNVPGAQMFVNQAESLSAFLVYDAEDSVRPKAVPRIA